MKFSENLKKLLSFLTAFAMVFGMVAMVQPLEAEAATVDIAISNGDFENGAFGGAVAGSNGASIVEKATYEGNYALKFDATGEILTVTGYLAEATTAESTVTLSFWAKVLSGSAGNSVNYGLFPCDESWQHLVSSGKYGAGYPIVGGEWKQITKEMTVPAGLKIVQAQIYLGSESTTAIVDSISITVDGNEILTSGGFEKGALNGDFNANDALEIVCTPVHGGNYAAHADQTSGNGAVTATISIEPSSEARTMTFSYWMYAPTSVNGAHNMVVCFDTSSGSWTNLSTKYGAQYATPGTWVQKTLEIAVAANTNTLQIQLYAQDTGADFYIDDLSLTEEVADIVNHEAVIGFNQVTDDGTWQMSLTSETEIPATYYKIPTTIDGTQCNILARYNGEILIIYPNFFPALGGAVPTSQIIIAEGAVLKAVDSANGWAEVDGAATVTVTQALDLSYVDGAWSKTVYNTDVTLSLNQVTGDGTWQFSISETPANKYYKVPAVIDGVEGNFLIGESGGLMCVYPNFFTALGGAVPTSQIVIAEGTVLKAVDSANGWAEIEGANTLTLTEKVDLSYVDGAWSKTVYTTNVALSFSSVQADGTWQFAISEAPANKYYKLPATIDGAECNVLIGESGGLMCIYPSFFTALNGAVPTQSLVIEEGAVLKAVDSANNWNEIADVNTLTVMSGLTIEYNLGVWQDMSQYSDVTFTEITADDLTVFNSADQAESNYRSVFGIKSTGDLTIDNDASWKNFVKVAGKVLVDGNEVSAVFGMAPDATGDSSWGADSAILLYITGEGYWDAASTASTVTICAGTTLISAVDGTHGYKFTEDFVMYKNCDGSWDTTANTHVYSQQNTELEGALVSEANCQSAAVYKYSCVCGAQGTETFTYGELGDHNYVDGTCSVCGDTISIQNITISLQTVTGDGTWQLVPSAAPADKYYKAPVIIDGKECNVLVQYGSNLLLIYPNFFTALNGTVPAESFVIPAGTMLKTVDSANGWAEVENATVLVVTEELKIENIAGKWVEMSKYADVSFTEVYAADLDLYYQNIMRLGDYSAAEIAMAKLQYPEIADLIEIYGDDANMTTIGIKSVNSALLIPNDANWATFTLLGTISIAGATAAETYVLQTPVSGTEDSDTAMDNAFLVRFYNGFILDNATSITIEPGTRIVTADGTTGFVFVDGYTIYRDENGNWSDVAPASANPVNKWGLTLGENIGVSFEMNVNEGDTVSFTVNGNAVTAEQNGSTYTIYVAAAQMTDAIGISVNGTALEKTYSVRGYADIILAGTYGEQTKALVQNMLNYGGAAQVYFGYNTDDLANNGIDVTASVPSGDAEVAISGSVSGIYFYGATLVHRDRTAVRFYFVADSIEGLTFTVNGTACETGVKNEMYYVEIAGINPQNLGDDVTVVVSNGTDELSVAYSPMDYMVRMYEKETSSDATKALVQALYGYYLAAVDYTA